MCARATARLPRCAALAAALLVTLTAAVGPARADLLFSVTH